MPELIVLNEQGHTTPSTRLPEALIGRWRGGESIDALAEDYDLPAEQVVWGIELAVWREAVIKGTAAPITYAANELVGLRRFEVRSIHGALMVRPVIKERRNA